MIYLKLWAIVSNNIVEKIDLSLTMETNLAIITGIYCLKTNTIPFHVFEIEREFLSKDEAVAHLERSFSEFMEKWPNASGFKKLKSDAPTEVIGRQAQPSIRILNPVQYN